MSLGQDCPVESAAPGGGSEPEQGLSLSARLLGLADAAPCPRDQVSTHVSIPAFGEPAGDTLVTRRLGEDHGGVDTPEELSLCCCCAGVMTQTSSPALRLLS